MTYAVVEAGGKQYIARVGETLEVDRLPLKAGDPVEWSEVLLLVNEGKVQVGRPTVPGARVKGKVLEQIKGRKILVFKYIPKERYRRRRGHRQLYTRVLIEAIESGAKPKPAKAADAKGAKAPAARKAASKKKAASAKAEKGKTPAKKTAAKKSTAGKAGAKKGTATRKKKEE
jgi:large subunit ribosomal protein L21